MIVTSKLDSSKNLRPFAPNWTRQSVLVSQADLGKEIMKVELNSWWLALQLKWKLKEAELYSLKTQEIFLL